MTSNIKLTTMLCLCLVVVFILSGCQSQGPVANSIVISPSPVHIVSNGESELKPDLDVRIYLKDHNAVIAHVWLDVVASAKFGTQTLAAKQEMTLAGRTRDGLLVYRWVIPGYLLETADISDLSKDKIDVYVRVEDETAKVKKFDNVIGLSRSSYVLNPAAPTEEVVLSGIVDFAWEVVGDVDHNEYENQLIICPKYPQESIWSGKGCQAIVIGTSDLLAGNLTENTSLKLKDGLYWWTLQRSDLDGVVIYQSDASFFLVDEGSDDWSGITLDGATAESSAWLSDMTPTWHLYYNGVLTAEKEMVADDLLWNIEGLIQAPGYYELLLAASSDKNAQIVSNVVTFIVEDGGVQLTLQEEFLLSDEEAAQLTAIMDDLLTIPPDQVEYFISRMAFQGVVDSEKLLALLDESGLSNQEIELMAERGQVEELTHIFAQAYVRDIFSLADLQLGLDEYLGGESNGSSD